MTEATPSIWAFQSRSCGIEPTHSTKAYMIFNNEESLYIGWGTDAGLNACIQENRVAPKMASFHESLAPTAFYAHESLWITSYQHGGSCGGGRASQKRYSGAKNIKILPLDSWNVFLKVFFWSDLSNTSSRTSQTSNLIPIDPLSSNPCEEWSATNL